MVPILSPVGREVPPEYMTVEEASATSGLSRRYLFRLAEQGRIDKYRLVGIRPTLFLRADVDRLLAPQRRSGRE